MECSICFEDIKNEREVLNCNHVFHEKCIEKWFSINHHCPLCRRSKFNKSMVEYEKNYYKNSKKIKNMIISCDNLIFKFEI